MEEGSFEYRILLFLYFSYRERIIERGIRLFRTRALGVSYRMKTLYSEVPRMINRKDSRNRVCVISS